MSTFRMIESLEDRRLLSFTIVATGDTQYYSEVFPGKMEAQTQWAVDHKADGTYNVAFLSHQGDIARRGYSSFQTGNADKAFDKLDAGGVPYAVAIGNHDFDNQFDDLDHHISSANFAQNFGEGRFAGRPNFGGASLDGRNYYQTFQADGVTFLSITLEWEPSQAAIDWAQGVINAHRNLPTIINTHEYLSSNTTRTTTPLDKTIDGSGQYVYNAGSGIWTKLVQPNKQIFMVLSGHTGPLYAHQTSANAGGSVFEILTHLEGRPNGGDGWMQLLTFDPANSVINVKTYSPTLNQYDTAADAQYSLPIDFATRFNFSATAGAPIANDDTIVLAPGASVTFDARANDYDPNGDLLGTPVASLPAGVVQNEDGTFTYTAPADAHGDVAFTYTTSDGGIASNAAKVTFRVNQAAVGTDDSAVTAEGRAVTVNVLANDAAVDGDALTPILASLPKYGAVLPNTDGSFTYTPDPKFGAAGIATDSFEYWVSDGVARGGVTDTAGLRPVKVTITVRPNQPIYAYPVAQTSTYGTVVGSLTALQTNDEGAEQVITEQLSGGVSKLTQAWRFNVTASPVGEVTFGIRAKRSWGLNEYLFAYSTNGGTSYTNMTALKDVTRVLYDVDEPYQLFTLPTTTSGTVWIKATQTNGSDTVLDKLTIDEMFIRSSVAFPTLNITSTTPSASESGTAAVFTITRTGNTTTNLVVGYQVAGSATAGLDYQALAGTVTIPAGSALATFSVTPIGDSLVEGDESVLVTVDPSAAYDVGANSAATATIRDVGPTGVVATSVSESQIDLAWTDATTDEEALVIERSTDGVNFAPVASVAADVTGYSDAGLSASTTYFYRVAATRGAAVAYSANVASAQTQSPPDTQAPTTPANVRVTAATSSTIALAWDASTDNVGVAGYSVYRNGTLVGTTTTQTAFTDIGLAASTTYQYTVVARDAVGNASAPSTAIPGTTASAVVKPTAPVLNSATTKSRKVTLKWSDKSTNESGFYIYYSTNGGASWIRYASVSANTTSYTTGTLSSGTYLFKVTAWNAGGESDSNVRTVLV